MLASHKTLAISNGVLFVCTCLYTNVLGHRKRTKHVIVAVLENEVSVILRAWEQGMLATPLRPFPGHWIANNPS